MKKKWILVMDSGIGGTYTLNKIKEVLPNENYIYFMDIFNAPYGNKSTSKLNKLSYNHIKKITSAFDVKLVVLACNTLSSVCYEFLKQKFVDLPIIKIEPFFLPEEYAGKNTLILATKNTIKHNKNLKRYEGYSNIYLKGFGSLAKKIDDANGNFDLLKNYLSRSLSEYKAKKIQNVVLGCTHFNFIQKEIKDVLGEDICFFENSQNVAKKIKKILTKSCLVKNDKSLGETIFLYKI